MEDAVLASAFSFKDSDEAFLNKGKVETIRQVNELLTSIWEQATSANTGRTRRAAEVGERALGEGRSGEIGEGEVNSTTSRPNNRPPY